MDSSGNSSKTLKSRTDYHHSSISSRSDVISLIEPVELKHANVKEKTNQLLINNLPIDIFDCYRKIVSRPSYSNCFSRSPSKATIKSTLKIDNMSLQNQEMLLLEDILYTLQGIEGEYITVSSTSQDSRKIELKIDPAFDSSLKTLAYRILPLCLAYHKVEHFTTVFSAYNQGTVVQALCESLKLFLDEYLTLICQFESELANEGPSKLSLQKLFAYCKPIEHKFEILCEICQDIEKAPIKGGFILSLLYRKSLDMIGDRPTVELCQFLLKHASKPYLTMLERWLYYGEIYDPYNEFMIRENEVINGKQLTGTMFDQIDNWENRYFIKSEICPTFLLSSSQKILNCGKYLNIISSCDSNTENCCKRQSLIDLSDRAFLEAISQAYNQASQTLIGLLLDQNRLLDCFVSLKHYFLLDQSDWLSHFLDLASQEELEQPLSDARLHRLESFLDIALRSSSLLTDLLRDEIKAYLKPSSLTSFMLHLNLINVEEPTVTDLDQTLKTRDAFTIKFDAKWPLSIIFNKKVMLQYEIIFRRLLQCKYIERRLACCWISKKYNTVPLFNLMLHEMLTFVKNYLYYATAEVLEPKWHEFYGKIVINTNNHQLTIDEALNEHNLFLDNCTKDCLLTDNQLVKEFQSILDCCCKLTDLFTMEKMECKVEMLKERFDEAQRRLLEQMKTMSASSQERIWTDIAYRLDLK